MTDKPPYTIVSAAVSQGAEMVRWLMERAGLQFIEQQHAPLLHILATLPVHGGIEVPVVVAPDGTWQTTMGLLDKIDAHAPAGRKVYGKTEAERTANRAFITTLLPYFGHPLRRFVYNQVLPDKAIMYPISTFGAPTWERVVVDVFYPVWRWLLGLALGFSTDLLAEAPIMLRDGLGLVDAELARRGTPFLNGSVAGGLDVTVSAMMAPLVFPPNYGGQLPPLDRVSKTLHDFVDEARARPAGDLVKRTYETARLVAS